MKEAELLARLEKRLSPARFEHSLGVRDTAMKLAIEYGAEVEKARLAGLLHDCAKNITNKNLLQKAKEFGIVIDEVMKLIPSLLHGPIGAEIAKKEFEIEDQAILNAIKNHTLGAAEMTLLEKIIFLADYIEPNRDCPGLKKLRKYATKDLDLAIRMACDQNLDYHLRKKILIHPQTLITRNAFLYREELK